MLHSESPFGVGLPCEVSENVCFVHTMVVVEFNVIFAFYVYFIKYLYYFKG